MNQSIISMNHSPKTQEPESQPLPFERDLGQLAAELETLTSKQAAQEFGASLSGMTYDHKCREYVELIIAARRMKAKAQQITNAQDEAEAWRVSANLACCEMYGIDALNYQQIANADPRTVGEKYLDEWAKDEADTRESVRPQ